MNPDIVRELWFTVPLVPPSGNHYKVPLWNQRRFYVTKEAKAFMETVCVCAARRQFRAKAYEVSLKVFLGKGQKMDCDNMPKVALDGLVKAGVIHTDAKVVRIITEKSRDARSPRTEIRIRAWPYD